MFQNAKNMATDLNHDYVKEEVKPPQCRSLIERIGAKRIELQLPLPRLQNPLLPNSTLELQKKTTTAAQMKIVIKKLNVS